MFFFDTETYAEPIEWQDAEENTVTGKHLQFRLGVAERWINKDDHYEKFIDHRYDNYENPIITDDGEELVNFLLKHNRNCCIFCHNLSFDIRIIAEFMPEEFKKRLDMFSFKKGMAFAIFNTPNKHSKIKFIDSHNFLKGTIEQMGNLLGLKKVGKEIDFDNVSDEELMKRCRRDVEILREGMIFVINNFVRNNQRMPLTLSQLSFSTFRNRFMKHQITICPPEHFETIRKMERDAYHGGRTEIFDLRHLKGVWELDVNGMYASVMRDECYPVKPIGIIDIDDPHELDGILEDDKLDLLADVTVETNKYIPIYPYKEEKLYFPTGKFKTRLTTPELELALENDELKEVHRAILYRSEPLFKEYVEHFSKKKGEAKRNGNKLMYLFYKLFSNGLYGKWAQSIGSWEEISDDEYYLMVDNPPNIDTNEIYHEGELLSIKKLFSKYWKKEDRRDGKYTSVIIGSLITAHARCKLWRYLDIADEPIYCDTDSIFIMGDELDKYEDVLHPTKLGYMDVELRDIEFMAKQPKWYKFREKNGEWQKKHKGVPYNAKKIAEDKYEYEYFMGFHESYNRFGEPKVVTTKRVKGLSSEYDKRNILPDGRTVPILIDQII